MSEQAEPGAGRGLAARARRGERAALWAGVLSDGVPRGCVKAYVAEGARLESRVGAAITQRKSSVSGRRSPLKTLQPGDESAL